MPVGIAVEASQRPLRIGPRRRFDGLDPAAPRLIVEYGSEGKAGALGLGNGADAAVAQLRHQCQEYPRGGCRIAERGMALDDIDTKPGGELLQRVAGQFRRGDLRQQPRVERSRPNPRQTGQVAFTLQHGKVEADRVSDHHGLAEIRTEARPDLGEQRRFRDHGVVDAMDARRLGRDRFTGRSQQLTKLVAGSQFSGLQSHTGELDHPRLARIEPGGLGIDDDGVDRQKRRDATRPLHRFPLAAETQSIENVRPRHPWSMPVAAPLCPCARSIRRRYCTG